MVFGASHPPQMSSYFNLKVLSGGEAMEEPYGGHVLESAGLKDCPREIRKVNQQAALRAPSVR